MYVSLDHVEHVASNIQTFWFKPERPLRYDAGQFIELTINHADQDSRGNRRWFTLSSSPTDSLLGVTTKLAAAPSSFKKHLFTLKPGDRIQISESMGDFVLPKDASIPLVFVGGGIGVTPLHSMMKYLHDTHQKRTIHLLYAAHSEQEIAFKNLFDTVATTTEYLTDRKLTSEDVLRLAADNTKPMIFLSGPEEMVEVFVDDLKKSGVPSSRLVTDYFPGYAGQI